MAGEEMAEGVVRLLAEVVAQEGQNTQTGSGREI